MNGDELVAVAFAETEGEAMVIRGLLESSGIPTILEPASHGAYQLGVGTWDRILGGRKQVMVHAEREAEARELLADGPESGGPGLS